MNLLYYAHKVDVQRVAQLAYMQQQQRAVSEFVGLEPDLQNILRFIIRLSLVYRKIDVR